MSKALSALAFSFTIIASSSIAHAVTTVVGVDESRVSNVVGLGTTNIIIYGGVAGSVTGANAGSCTSAGATSTCSNCVTPSTGSGDARLLPCNDRRIHPSLALRITVQSDSIESGIPRMSSFESGATTDTIIPPNGGTPTAVSKNSPGTIEVLWSSICPKVFSSGSGGTNGGTGCTVNANTDQLTGTFRVGIDNSASGTQGQLDGDEYVTITITVRDGIIVNQDNGTTGSSIITEGEPGIQYFEIGSGDNKAVVKTLRASNGFPNGNNTTFGWMRVLWEPRITRTAPVWTEVTSGSPHVDLEVDGTDPNNISLSPTIVTGGTKTNSDGSIESASVVNDQIYDFKIAIVDLARNVGYYTAAADDQACDSPDSVSNESNVPECHTARPAEVVGALSEDLNCFVATASYGSPMAREVQTFRNFRDRFLMPTKLGKKFVAFYYDKGPIAAKFIAQSETLRAAGRGILWAPLEFAKFSLHYGIFAGLALLAFIFMAPPALWFGARRLRGRSSRV